MAAPVLSNLTASGSSGDTTSYTTGSFTVTAEKPVLLAVHNRSDIGAQKPSSITPMSGVAAVELGTITYNTNYVLTVYYLTGAGTGTATIDFAALQIGCQWWADQADDADETAPSGGNVVSASGESATATVDLTSVTAGNSVWMVTAVAAQVAFNNSANYTQTATRIAQSNPSISLGATARANHDDPTPDQPLASSQKWAAIAVELAPEPAAATWVPKIIII